MQDVFQRLRYYTNLRISNGRQQVGDLRLLGKTPPGHSRRKPRRD